MAQLKREMTGLRSSLHRPLSETDVGKIANAALEALEKEKQSVQYMRSEFFVPKLAIRKKRGRQQPGDDALSRARARVTEIGEGEHKSRLPDDVSAPILDRFGAIRRGLPA